MEFITDAEYASGQAMQMGDRVRKLELSAEGSDTSIPAAARDLIPKGKGKITINGREPSGLEDSVTVFMTLARQIRPGAYYDDDVRALRVRLLREEFEEYLGGEDTDDVVEIADGLADILVIAFGTLVTYFGPPVARQILDEVLKNNLSKVDGSLGPLNFREDGKVLKPDGYTPPNVRGILIDLGWVAD